MRLNTNVNKNSVGQNKQCQKYSPFAFASSLLLIRGSSESWNKMFVTPKTVCKISHFRFRSVFIKVSIFVQQNTWTIWLNSVIIPFKIKVIEKSHTVLLHDLWFFKLQQEVWKFNDICVIGAPQNWPGDEFFKLRRLKVEVLRTSVFFNSSKKGILANLFISLIEL